MGERPRLVDDLTYLDRLADTVARLEAVGAHDDAGRLLERTLDAIDHELVVRGNTVAPALFDTLLLAAQQAREPVLVQAKEIPDVESR